MNHYTRSCFYDKLDTTKRQCLLIKLTDEKGHVGLRLDLPVTVLISNYGFVFESLLLAIQVRFVVTYKCWSYTAVYPEQKFRHNFNLSV